MNAHHTRFPGRARRIQPAVGALALAARAGRARAYSTSILPLEMFDPAESIAPLAADAGPPGR